MISHDQFKSHFPGLAKHFDEQDGRALLNVLDRREAKAGEVLITHQAETDTMFLVERGLLTIHIEENGKKLVLGQAGPGMVVGEIAMIEPGPASATVLVVEDASLFTIDHETFEQLRRRSPKTANAMLLSLSRDLTRRLRHAGNGLLWRIDEHHWMKLEAQKDERSWLQRLAALAIGMPGGSR